MPSNMHHGLSVKQLAVNFNVLHPTVLSVITTILHAINKTYYYKNIYNNKSAVLMVRSSFIMTGYGSSGRGFTWPQEHLNLPLHWHRYKNYGNHPHGYPVEIWGTCLHTHKYLYDLVLSHGRNFYHSYFSVHISREWLSKSETNGWGNDTECQICVIRQYCSSDNSCNSPDWGTKALDMMSCKKELTEVGILLK